MYVDGIENKNNNIKKSQLTTNLLLLPSLILQHPLLLQLHIPRHPLVKFLIRKRETSCGSLCTTITTILKCAIILFANL